MILSKSQGCLFYFAITVIILKSWFHVQGSHKSDVKGQGTSGWLGKYLPKESRRKEARPPRCPRLVPGDGGMPTPGGQGWHRKKWALPVGSSRGLAGGTAYWPWGREKAR